MSGQDIDAASSPHALTEAGHAHHMQNRGLSGFLTPLGRLAGMFGWTPSKCTERLSSMPGNILLADASVESGRRPDARQQLAQLIKPANALIADAQSLPANLLSIRPEQLTLDQLHNLQRAAELLSPRRTSPWQAQMQSVPTNTPLPVLPVAAAAKLADAVSLQHPAQPGQCGQPRNPDHGQGSLHSSLHGTSPSGLKLDSNQMMTKPATEHDAEMHADSSSQVDDMLAAQLASRLSSMAPQLSSLYTDSCLEQSVVRPSCCVKGKQMSAESYKRKHIEGSDWSHDGRNLQSSAEECTVSLSTAHVKKHRCNASVSTDARPVVVNSSIAEDKYLAPSAKEVHQMQHSLQHYSEDLQVQPRKKFKKTTGLEVLYRCMPSLWQTPSQLKS